MKTFLIAEIGTNWQSLDDIKRSIDSAMSAGASACKLQAWHTDHFVAYHKFHLARGLLQQHEIKEEWYKELFGLPVFFSVFCPDIVEQLEVAVNPAYYKIAAPDCNYEPIIQAVEKTHKQFFMSETIGHKAKRKPANCQLLHCVSAYPAISSQFRYYKPDWHDGLSDHTLSNLPAAMAVGLGATVIEKHFKYKQMNTMDAGHSLLPEQFRELVKVIEEAEDQMYSEADYMREQENLKIAIRGEDGLRH